MATPPPASEEIIYEKADAVADRGAVFFVTVILRDEARGRMTRESHVFLPSEKRHLHEIEDAPLTRAVAGPAAGLASTHGLLARHLVRTGNERATGGEGLSYVTHRLAAHPFHGFRLRNEFADALWEIQDWSLSPGLRAALAGVTRYRFDSAEAELLGRIFAAG
jgi:hypothetical protein